MSQLITNPFAVAAAGGAEVSKPAVLPASGTHIGTQGGGSDGTNFTNITIGIGTTYTTPTAGDTMFVIGIMPGDGTPDAFDAPAGWTKVLDATFPDTYVIDAFTDTKLVVWRKVAGSSEGAAVWTPAAGAVGRIQLTYVCVQGNCVVDTYGVALNGGGGNVTSHPTPSVNPSALDTMVIYLFENVPSAVWTGPGGVTTISGSVILADIAAAPIGFARRGATYRQALASGDPVSVTATTGTATKSVAAAVVLRGV